jgi:hypothetical protein
MWIKCPLNLLSNSFMLAIVFWVTATSDCWAQLQAGVAKIDITNREAGPVNDPLYAKALVLRSSKTTVVIVSVDAVAIGEIGYIKNDYLPTVRQRLKAECGIEPLNVLVNASHCHGVVCDDVAARTIDVVKLALEKMVEVRVGSGRGHEDRIMENRRLKLKSGRIADVRHAYALPPDDVVAEVGPVDPQIGILRLDRLDGRTLAVVYNFAIHPIQGVPSGANTADITGFASKVIEDNLSDGAIALFLQGCGGDINPVLYKDVEHPRNGEPLGNQLGLSTLQAIRKIVCRKDDRLKLVSKEIELPRGDRTPRIFQMEDEQKRLLASLKGTTLNLKTFLPLAVKYSLAEDFPAYYSHRYMHDANQGRNDWQKLDANNRRDIKAYIENIHAMEELTRIQTNLDLLRKHQASFAAAAKRTVDVELSALRVGDFVLTTFPGELTVQIGLNIKKAATNEHTFVAAYTNGYIYYAPTTEQLLNPGGAQEDCDCILAPDWQATYEEAVVKMLKEIQ